MTSNDVFAGNFSLDDERLNDVLLTNSIVSDMVKDSSLKQGFSPQSVENIVNFISAIPPEVALRLWRKISVININNAVKVHSLSKDRMLEILLSGEAREIIVKSHDLDNL